MANIACVIGGAGFLGSHIADKLSEGGYKVRIFDRTESPWARGNQEIIIGDILDDSAVKLAIQGSSIVYNLAALADLNAGIDKPGETVRINILGNCNVLEACVAEKITRFVYASSVYVFSNQGGFYRCSKQAAESYVEEFGKTYSLPYTILRYGSLYGPRSDRTNGMYNLVKSAIDNQTINYRGSPNARREYIHVEDAAQASVDILAPKYAGQSLALTGSESMLVSEVMDMLNEILGGSLSLCFDESGAQPGHYIKTPYSFKPSPSRKYSPEEYIDLGQGLLDLIEYVAADQLK